MHVRFKTAISGRIALCWVTSMRVYVGRRGRISCFAGAVADAVAVAVAVVVAALEREGGPATRCVRLFFLLSWGAQGEGATIPGRGRASFHRPREISTHRPPLPPLLPHQNPPPPAPSHPAIQDDAGSVGGTWLLHTGRKCNRGMHRIFRRMHLVQRTARYCTGWQLVRGSSI